MSAINKKNNFEVVCGCTFSLPPGDTPEKRAQDIMNAVHKIAERMSKMTFEDLKVHRAGVEKFFTEPTGSIYGTQGLVEHIENTKSVRVEVEGGKIRVIEE
jgi:2'-5' RNA ligase